MMWPIGVRVGHTNTKHAFAGSVLLSASDVVLTPDEARAVAAELLLRADFQDRTEDTRLIDEIPRRIR